MSMKNPVVQLVSREDGGTTDYYLMLTSLFEKAGYYVDGYELPADLTLSTLDITAYVASSGANLKSVNVLHHLIPVTAIDFSSSKTLNINVKLGSTIISQRTVIISTSDPDTRVRPYITD